MAATRLCFVRADKVAFTLYFSAPHTHTLTLKSVVRKKQTKKILNAALAVQPSQEMSIETVWQETATKGRRGGRRSPADLDS